jgi:hypothetical protein
MPSLIRVLKYGWLQDRKASRNSSFCDTSQGREILACIACLEEGVINQEFWLRTLYIKPHHISLI